MALPPTVHCREKESPMRRSIQALLLALVLLTGFVVGVATAPPADAAPTLGVKCWTTCCELQPWRCVTCCPGMPCPDLACP